MIPTINRRRSFKGSTGEISASRTEFLRQAAIGSMKDLAPEPVKGEQSNTSVVYGNRFMLKLFRNPEEGVNPDVEIGRFLTEQTSFTNIAQVAGSLEYHRGRRRILSLAILQSYIVNEGDAWHYTLDSLDRYFEEVAAHPTVQVPPLPAKHFVSLLAETPSLAKDTIGAYLASVQLLGQRTAELHVALASGKDNADFAPEAFTLNYQTSLYQSLRGLARRNLLLLRDSIGSLPENIREDASKVASQEKAIIERYNLVRRGRIEALRIRCHGDYHLGQVLFTGKDFVITDFEGEPARSISERRLKRSPLRDVAGMLRSFHYASQTALEKQVPLRSRPEDVRPLLERWAEFWYIWVSVEFLKTYLDIIGKTELLPKNPEHIRTLLDAFIMDKAVYEIGYELNNRPDWVRVPIQGILRLLAAEG